jgi:ABC-type antimicrobial peptide transport system permease subunit
VAIVNAAFARAVFRGRAALGATIATDLIKAPMSIVGVAADVSPGGEPDRPAVYVSMDQLGISGGSLLVRTQGDAGRIVSELRARMKAVAPSLARDRIHVLADDLAEQRAAARFATQLVGTFAVLALALAAIGVYGLVSGEVTARSRELAIRTALGATQPEIISIALRSTALASLAGVLSGSIAAVAARRAIRSSVEVAAGAGLTAVLAAAIVLAVVALTAALLAVSRITRADPNLAFRSR